MERQGQTQPSRPLKAETRPKDVPLGMPAPPQGARPPRTRIRKILSWMWVLVGAILVVFASVTGALAGYQSGEQARQELEARHRLLALSEQYQLGLLDMEAGRYEVAMQRFEYILKQNPSFPGVNEEMAKVARILHATATPTPPPPTPTPTPPEPTPDLRPLQDLFAQAQTALAAGDWNAVIDTLIVLRGKDPAYQTTRVDGMLFLALRHRGVDKILKGRDLEGGSYDLSLAERFGPLDTQADAVRSWARLYMYGSGFWEADPARAVYYFSQVSAAAPYLTDGSGWTAMSRYWAALIQYGDYLAKQGNWCAAQAQYELALSIRSEAPIQATAAYSAEQCSPPTATPMPETPTPTPTLSPTPTQPVPGSPTPVPTTPTLEIPTPTLTLEPSATPTQSASPSLAPTGTPTQEMVPSSTPTLSETPTSGATTSANPGKTTTLQPGL